MGNQGKPSRRLWERSMFGSFHSPTDVVFVVLKSLERERARLHPRSKKITHTKTATSSNNTPRYGRMLGAYATARTPGATGARRQDGAQVLFWASDVPLRTRVLVPSCGKLNSRTFSDESGTDFPQDERNARVS